MKPAKPLPAEANTAPPAELAGRLRLAVGRLERILRQQDPHDLGTGLTSALATIDRHGPLTFGELAAAERISPPSVTTIVRKLEDRGLVERSPDDRDRRIGRLRATAAGRRHLTAARARRTAWLTVQLAAVDGAQLARLAGAVEALEELLQTEAASG